MTRPYNFSAGPAALPEAVLKRAQAELLDFAGTGSSVMELSHRGKPFMAVAERAEANLRQLMNISDDYAVLFLQGGATSQFAMVPMNLITGKSRVDYFDTGMWSKKAIKEAGKFAQVNIVASSADSGYSSIPNSNGWSFSSDAAYVHFTPNETIGGVEFHSAPQVGSVPLVADMSSTILSRPIDVSEYGVIYAGAQKNIGPAGLTLVIVRRDLIGNALASVPSMFNYATHADAGSMSNTPPTLAWYLAGLVFEWLLEQGGLSSMAETNERKAAKLYAAIDASSFYTNPVQIENRSWMNVPFTLADAALDGDFLVGAQKAGLDALKGHRSVGGMRASIYNAMPEAGVDALIAYMADFEKNHG